jgi:hypothetical protein
MHQRILLFPPDTCPRIMTSRVEVHNEVVAESLCQKLVEEIMGSVGADSAAREVSRMLPVPLALYENILSIVQVGGDKQVPRQQNAVLVPARASAHGVPLHQVDSSS